MKYLRNHFPISSLFLAATFSLMGFMCTAQETTPGDTELVVWFCHLGDEPVTYAYRVRESGQIETLDGAPGTGLRNEREDVLLLPDRVLRFRDQEVTIDESGDIDTGYCSDISDIVTALVVDVGASMTEQLVVAIQARENFAARLAEALDHVTSLEAELVQALLDLSQAERREAEALAARMLAEINADERLREAEMRSALLAQANLELETAEAASAESQRQIAALNEQVAALRTQLGELQGLLDVVREEEAREQVRAETCEADLNAALTRLAMELDRTEAECSQVEN
ncbi:hypothetical protein [Nioella ostreopsis]|uniref:hypothetical protein n=1 Tax=Nioella ostreopsis TaxID=2448479 RepID=UPI000FD7B94B|nr:hypothetical protein [Nioella ostreopsis]